MPTWDEICQVLEQLWTLIEEIQSELANLVTVQERRPGLQQLLTACFAMLHGMRLWKSMQKDPDAVR